MRKLALFGCPIGVAGDGVDVLRREAVLEHLVDRRHHRVRADAVADEVRRVLAEDDALAEHVLAEAANARERRRDRCPGPPTSSRSFM